MDALWFAIGANKGHGERPTRGDVRHAVLLALKTWGDGKSQQEIALQVGCNQSTVQRIRSDVMQTHNVPIAPTRTDTLGREQPTRKPRKARAEGEAHLVRQGCRFRGSPERASSAKGDCWNSSNPASAPGLNLQGSKLPAFR